MDAKSAGPRYEPGQHQPVEFPHRDLRATREDADALSFGHAPPYGTLLLAQAAAVIVGSGTPGQYYIRARPF